MNDPTFSAIATALGDTLAENDAAIDARFAALETLAKAMAGAIRRLDAKSGDAKAELAALIKDELAEVHAALASQVDADQVALAGMIESRLAGLDAQTIATVTEWLAEPLAYVDGGPERDADVDERFKLALEAIGGMRADFAVRASEIAEQVEALAKSQDAALDEVAPRLKALAERLDELADAMAPLPVDLGEVTKRLDDAEARLADVEIRPEPEPGKKGDQGDKGDKGDRGDVGREGEPGAGITVKLWEPGVYREGTIVQHDLGRFSRAKCDTASAPGTSDDWERIGSGGFAWKGLRRDDATYEDGDLYVDGGSGFMFVQGKGRLWAKAGRKGDQGDKGDKGDRGDAGPAIITAHFDAKGLAFIRSDGAVIDCEGSDAITAWLAEPFAEIIKRLDAAEARVAELEARPAAKSTSGRRPRARPIHGGDNA